ncbi:MAG: mercuric transporter MerT family protein [Verrucomicrobia bacterium]|nr:mercuric transporter MerT family protein [Verrucomicrobiota bacterium]
MKVNNQTERKGKWLVGGGLGAAFIASLCCIGPAVFIALGLGSFAAAGIFESLRPWFALVAVLALGFAWWQALRKKACADGSCEIPAKSRKSQIVFLSLVSLLAMGFLAYPSIANLILKTGGDTQTAMGPNSSELVVAIPSMDCAACAVGIQRALNKVEGIDSAQISYENKKAVVVYNSQKVTQATIFEAIRETGFPPEEIKP